MKVPRGSEEGSRGPAKGVADQGSSHPGPRARDDKEASILNRIVRCCDDCLLYEADHRHVEKLLREAGLEDCKSVTTLGVKEASATTTTAWFEESGLPQGPEEVFGGMDLALDLPDLRPLDREEMRRYRSAVARCNYLAVDRFEIAFITKELCRAVSKPTVGDANLRWAMPRQLHACAGF